jgi:hypothetical protein
VKAGKTPEAWQKNPAKSRQKDKDARWTKKHGKKVCAHDKFETAGKRASIKDGRSRQSVRMATGRWRTTKWPRR